MADSINSIVSNNQKSEIPAPEVLNNTALEVQGNESGVSANIPLPTTQKVEEFTYHPKPRINLKRASKIIVGLLSFLLLLVPLVIIFIKFNPLAGKKTEKKGEIVWWALGLNESVLNKMIEEYLASNPKAKIKLVVQSEVYYRERFMNSLKEGNDPDVFSIHNSWVPMLMDYLDAVPQKVYGKDDYSKDYYPVIVRNMTTTSGIVGIPLEYDALTLYINEEIFSFSGKVVPRTWDEFNQVAVELTTKGDKNLILQSGAAMGLTANVDYWPEIIALLMLQNKSNLFSPSGKTSFEAISAFGEFNNTLKIWNNTLPRSTIAFAEGKAAMFFAPAKAASEIKKINPDLKFKTVVIPQVRRDDPNEPEIAYSTYWVQSVWKGSSDKELAWDFLKFLSSEESLTKMFNYSKDIGVLPMIYPRINMRDKLINDKIFGSVVAQAPFATSWYLADRTNDGATGINSVVNAAYKKSVDAVSVSKGIRYSEAFFKSLATELKKGLLTFNVTK
jgi:ABC-type glycerol-3-phosphate transport system substrate-binding protein